MKLPLALAFVAVLSLISSAPLQAQLNEKKVERDATGLYKGKKFGGTKTVYYSGFSPMVMSIPTNFGKMRVPVASEKLNTVLNDSEIPDGQVKFTGREKKSHVSRNGNKIGYVANKGKMIQEGHAPFTGGKMKGPITDKGSKWKATTKISARAVSSTETEVVSGMKASGKH